MRNALMPPFGELPLRKRAIVQTVIGRLKKACRVERSRHRTPANHFADVVAALVADAHGEKLPSLALRPPRIQPLDEAALRPSYAERTIRNLLRKSPPVDRR
jgi:hypothetical protein